MFDNTEKKYEENCNFCGEPSHNNLQIYLGHLKMQEKRI